MSTVLRVIAALLVLAGGVLHYLVWDSDYRDIPDGAVPGLDVVKIGIPVNVGLSVLLAILIVVFAHRPIVWLAALLFEVASIATLVLSRQGGVLGWEEEGWSTDAKQILAVEAAAVVVLAFLLVFDFIRSGRAAEEAT